MAEAGEFGCTTTGNVANTQVFGMYLLLPLEPLGQVCSLSWENLVTPSGVVWLWGGMCPAIRSASSSTAYTGCGTADQEEMLKPFVLCNFTAQCLHLGTCTLLTLYLIFTFFSNFPSQQHMLSMCPGLDCAPAALRRCSALSLGSAHHGNWVFLLAI